jgi:hypothetical protein
MHLCEKCHRCSDCCECESQVFAVAAQNGLLHETAAPELGVEPA